MGNICHSETDPLGTILDGRTSFIVPNYQRAYSWGNDKVNELWEDLVDGYASDPNHLYLLGPIVVVKLPGTRILNEIVDGQQRLVTLTLLFCALRNSLAEHEPNNEFDKKDYTDLIDEINKSIRTDAKQPLIKLNNKDDNDVFTDICNAKNPLQNTTSNTSLTANYDILLKLARELCKKRFDKENDRDAIRSIRKTFCTIKNNTNFIYVTIQDEDYSYQVFQSLNSKGQKLNQADLIKSILLNKAPDKVTDRWDAIMSSKPIKKNPDDFLYYSMLSRTCPKSDGSDEVLKIKMSSRIKSKCKNPTDVEEYLKELSEDSRIIEVLNRPETLRSEDKYDLDFIHFFYGIQQINAKYFRRPIITAYREWGSSNSDTKLLIGCLLKFFFMYRTISKLDIDLLKRIARDVTCHILNGKKLDEILYTILKSEKPGVEDNINQDDFMNEFKNNINNLKTSVATYILYSLEKKLHDDQGTHIEFNKYHIEYIFPKNPDYEKWANKDELDDHKNRLGNLTLLDMKWNATMKNYSFEDKRNKGTRCYLESGLELNKKYLRKYERWGIEEIEKREKELIECASGIWNLAEYLQLAKKPQD